MRQSEFTKKYIIDLEGKKDILVKYFTMQYGKKNEKLVRERLEKAIVMFKGSDQETFEACLTSIQNMPKAKRQALLPQVQELINLIEEQASSNGESQEQTGLMVVSSRGELAVSENNGHSFIENDSAKTFLSLYKNNKNFPAQNPENLKVLKEQFLTVMEATNNHCAPIMFRKNNGKVDLASAVSFNLSQLCDHVIIHELDHAIATSLIELKDLIKNVKGGKIEKTSKNVVKRKKIGAKAIPLYIGGEPEEFYIHLDESVFLNQGFHLNETKDLLSSHDMIKEILQKNLSKEELKKLKTETFSRGLENKWSLEDLVDFLEAYNRGVSLRQVQSEKKDGDYRSALTFFDEVCTDYRTKKIVEAMRNDGVEIFDNTKDFKSQYSLAFDGCAFMLDSLMPCINDHVINGKTVEFIEKVGLYNFVNLIYHVQHLYYVNEKKVAGNFEDFYLRHKLGMAFRPLNEEEKEYVKHIDAINLCVKDMLEKLNIQDENIDFVAAAIYANQEQGDEEGRKK